MVQYCDENEIPCPFSVCGQQPYGLSIFDSAHTVDPRVSVSDRKAGGNHIMLQKPERKHETEWKSTIMGLHEYMLRVEAQSVWALDANTPIWQAKTILCVPWYWVISSGPRSVLQVIPKVVAAVQVSFCMSLWGCLWTQGHCYVAKVKG